MIIAATMGFLATKTKQPLIVAYILTGIICGPWGLSVLTDSVILQELSHTGIALLLFIAGLELNPHRFFKQVSGLVYITLGICSVNTLLFFIICTLMGYSQYEAVLVGVALMFSSTLLFIKLMPTNTEHQKKINSFCLSVLIIEDIIAVIALMTIALIKGSNDGWTHWVLLPIEGIAAIIFTFAFEKYILRLFISKTKTGYEETTVLIALGWCLGVALLFKSIGFSLEIGAFLAGIALSQSSQSKDIEKSLIFLRDFFLIIFFVTLGAEIDLYLSRKLLLPTLLLSGTIILLKPYILQFFFKFGENSAIRVRESSIRLGQSSEFGLLISLLSYEHGLISLEVSKLIQLSVIFSLVFSSLRIFVTYTQHINQDCQ